MRAGSVSRKLEGSKGRNAQGRRGVTEGPRRAAKRANDVLLECSKIIEGRQVQVGVSFRAFVSRLVRAIGFVCPLGADDADDAREQQRQLNASKPSLQCSAIWRQTHASLYANTQR